MLETIMVPVEGTERTVYVPVTALQLSDILYEILSFEEPGQRARWRFPSGSVVRCERRIGGRMKVPVAIELAPRPERAAHPRLHSCAPRPRRPRGPGIAQKPLRV